MTPITITDKSIEIKYRNFVIARFKNHMIIKDGVRRQIKKMAEMVIHGTANAHGDVLAAVRGMIEGVKIAAQDCHLNVQSAVCEAATAAYYTALEDSKDLAEKIKRIAEEPYSGFRITLYKKFKQRNDVACPS